MSTRTAIGASALVDAERADGNASLSKALSTQRRLHRTSSHV
ncbi:hypothetical protein BN903_11 [Halorubrum sp. AJ67]|nr:hypothetical protein BN903_11 [Halorubrum sp. AJ67]